MFKKHKIPTSTRAQKMSKKGCHRRTKATIDSCIKTIATSIEYAAENGDFNTHVYLRNNTGFLTPTAIALIKEYYIKLGYIVEVTLDEPRYEGDSDSYTIRINWEE